MGSPVWGGGFGGGNVSNINIEANPIQSNILTQGPTTTSAAGRDTGAISVDNPQTPTVDTSTTGEIGPGTETPARREAPAAHDVAYRSDYTGDLTAQQAAGKANQLLSRALGEQGVTSQAEYNKYFEPLYQDLQKGGDYGHDISRFYGAIEKGGRTPYQDFAGPLGKGTYGDFMGGINTREAMGGFYDPADLGRRALEAKALYRPGGEGTNLDKVGMLQKQWEAYDTEPFYGKSRGYGKDAGYRAGGTAWTGGQGRDAWKQYYEAYLAGA